MRGEADARLRLGLFGGLRLAVDRQSRELPSLARARSLLAYLALHPGGHPRGDLAARFWPDVVDESARTSLRTALSAIRKALGDDDLLVATRDHVALADAWTDVARFEQLLADGRPREALELYAGPLLAGLDDDWVYERRDALRERAAESHAALASAAEARGELGAALDHTRAWAALDPLDEGAVRELMRRLDAGGDRAGALTAYERLSERLRTQLGVAPAPATRAAAAAIRSAGAELTTPPEVTSPQPQPQPPRAAGVVTLLFTDLVGSTEMLGRLGEDAAEQLRREHFGLLRDVIAEHNGEEVKNLGDGLMTVFASSVDALRCAVAIQQRTARFNARSPASALAVRVGVNAGEPFRSEDDWFGTPVVVAKRLCDRADGAQILVSALVRDLVGGRGGFAFRDLGGLDLKGIGTAVAATELGWDVDPQRALPLPEPLSDPRAADLVGRAGELARLHAAWDLARTGRPAVVTLTGDPGIGKSRLAAELCAQAREQNGASVLLGRCHEEPMAPYQPFVEALERYAEVAHPDDLRLQAGDGRAALTRLVPTLGRRLPGATAAATGDPDADTYRLFDAVARLLRAVAATRPSILVLDDVHWADEPSLRLLTHVVRELGDAPLLIVATYRSTELGGPLAATLASLRRLRAVEETALEGLDAEAVAALVRARAGDAASADDVHERTEGNPFFVEELLREGSEEHVPASIQDLIVRRLRRLDEDSARMLVAAAVTGREFEAAVLASVTTDDEDLVIDRLEAATHAHVVREVPRSPGRFAFTHALVRETLYEQASAARRARMHARVGAALEARGADPAVLAHHFLAAGDEERAFTHSLLAARAARRVAAIHAAAQLYDQACRLAGRLGRTAENDDAVRELLLERSILGVERSELTNCLPDVQAALNGARAAGDRHLEMRALNQLGYVLRIRDLRSALPPHEAALAIARELGDHAAEVEILNRMTLLHAVRLQFERSLAAGEQALSLARATGDPSLVARALDGLKLPAWHLGELDRLDELTTELIALTPPEQPWYLGFAVMESAFVAIGRGDWDEADARVARAMGLASRSGSKALRAHVLETRSWLRRGQGRLEDAIADARRASDDVYSGGVYVGWMNATLGTALLEAGDVAAAASVLEDGLAGAAASGAPADELRCAGQLAWARALLGEPAAAADAAARAERALTEATFPPGGVFVFGGHGILGAARAHLAAGDGERAAALAAPLHEAATGGGWLEFAGAAAAVLAEADHSSGQNTS